MFGYNSPRAIEIQAERTKLTCINWEIKKNPSRECGQRQVWDPRLLQIRGKIKDSIMQLKNLS